MHPFAPLSIWATTGILTGRRYDHAVCELVVPRLALRIPQRPQEVDKPGEVGGHPEHAHEHPPQKRSTGPDSIAVVLVDDADSPQAFSKRRSALASIRQGEVRGKEHEVA